MAGRINATTFSDVVNLFKYNKELDLGLIGDKLNRKKTVVNQYLAKLKRWNIITSEKKGLNRVWKLNPELSKINIYRRY